MSAAWDRTVETEDIKRQRRATRMWCYLAVGSLFYIYLRFKIGF
jgi:hypothetical protein